MLYISDIFNVDTKEHYDRIKSFTQAQMMYCVELRDFTTGEQRAMCMPKVVVAEEIIPFEFLVIVQSLHHSINLYGVGTRYIKLSHVTIKLTVEKDLTVPITKYIIRRKV